MSNIEKATAITEAFNSRDWDGHRQYLADNCTYVEFATGRESTGPDAWVGNSQAWAAAFSNAKGETTSSYEVGNTVIQEITWTGTNDGPMTTPDGQSIPATNNSMTTHASWIVTFEGGKVVRAHHYFDMMSMMAQLGLVG